VGVTSWTGELFPGSHRVSLKLDGYETASQVFELRADRSLDVNVTLKAKVVDTAPVLPNPAPQPPDRHKEDAPPPSAPAALLPVGIATAAVGVGGIAAAVGLEVARSSAENAARRAPVQVDAQSHLDAMQSYQLGARIAAGVGAGLVLAGGTMTVVALAMRPSKSKPAPSVSAVCLPGACAASVTARF
jgi:PEGA domain